MSNYFDTGGVKALLSTLFRSELGFIRSANLAGEMIKIGWNSKGENLNQRTLAVLLEAASQLNSSYYGYSDVLLYCHCATVPGRQVHG